MNVKLLVRIISVGILGAVFVMRVGAETQPIDAKSDTHDKSDTKISTPYPVPGVAGAIPSASRKSLTDKKTRPYIFADPKWFQWGASCVRDDSGKYHLFYSRWRRDNPRGMFGWLYESEICRATADHPEGPYTYQETVLKGFGEPQPQRWDARNAHNPCITRMRDPDSGKLRYYLYYIATRDDNTMGSDWWDQIINQRIGVAVADSPEGPWVRHPRPVIEPPNGQLRHYLVNPGVCQLPDGRFLMVLKGRAEGNGKHHPGPMLHGWALADHPEGPFTVQDTLLFPSTIPAEDPCVWVEDGWLFAAVKDWHGKIGGRRGISYIRGKLNATGGVDWVIPKSACMMGREILWDDGQKTRLYACERPYILLDKNGHPSHLFVAASEKNPFVNARRTPSKSSKKVPLRNLPFNLCLPLVRSTPVND